MIYRVLSLIVFVLLLSQPVLGQENKTRQQELEAQRQRLQKEIKSIGFVLQPITAQISSRRSRVFGSKTQRASTPDPSE